MSKRRVRSTQRKAGTKKRELAEAVPAFPYLTDIPLYSKKKSPRMHRFLGVSLSGGKTSKTCLSVVEYYPDQDKIFLSRLFDRIKNADETSADLQLHQLITECPGPVESLSLDVPFKMPKCVRCRLKCPGYEACGEPEIKWMWKHYRERNQKKTPKKLFTPYTERCVELYLRTELEEPFHLSHALGANAAPLTARAFFITRRLNMPVLEVFPKLSLWRIGRSLHVSQSHLRFHRHWHGGQESREAVISKLIEKNLAFIYDQDHKMLVENAHAFDSFICALTGFLSFRGLCEHRPKGFPRSETWIQIPRTDLIWP